jgi:hypothetical protein
MLVPGGFTASVVMQNAEAGTADGTALDCWTAENGASTTASFQITGVDGETITWEATIDGTNYVAIAVDNLASGSAATTATANGLYRVTCHGLRKIRARISTGGSGAVTVIGVVAA